LPISFGEAAAGMDTGELAVVLLVATSTHMDLTRIVASQPAVLSSEAREGNNRSSEAEQGTQDNTARLVGRLLHCICIAYTACPGLYLLAGC
jgi:hypothetical protein